MSDQPEQKDVIQQLADLLEESGATVRIGLRAQGHMPTVTRMLCEGATWKDIGKVIGWCPDTARDWYAREAARVLAADPSLSVEPTTPTTTEEDSGLPVGYSAGSNNQPPEFVKTLTFETPATKTIVLCSRCGKRAGTEIWSEGTIAYVHGLYAMWCRVCVVSAQLAHARSVAGRIPDLEIELVGLLTNEA